MTRVRTHLLLPPLEIPEPLRMRSDPDALRSAAALYDQLVAKGYSAEHAERLSQVARLTGAGLTYSDPTPRPS
ncbi:MAG TPA: hypothetical protein VFW64_12450 [Pseudonocardiaceae bacterium]|nr:hypothetical protein [Pseudonocardiaceae bacterium]